MSTTLKIAARKSWRPSEYFQEYLNEFGVLAPETQTLIRFGATMVGVAVISGRFLQWQAIDQIVAVVVLLGIARLLFRAG